MLCFQDGQAVYQALKQNYYPKSSSSVKDKLSQHQFSPKWSVLSWMSGNEGKISHPVYKTTHNPLRIRKNILNGSAGHTGVGVGVKKYTVHWHKADFGSKMFSFITGETAIWVLPACALAALCSSSPKIFPKCRKQVTARQQKQSGFHGKPLKITEKFFPCSEELSLSMVIWT